MQTENNPQKQNAVIYCRVSTEEQAQEGESLSSQERKCIAFAEKNGFTVISKFIEKGESGRTEYRTQFQKLLGFCFDKRNNVSTVICLKQDRFSRNLLVQNQAERALQKSNIRLMFVEGNNENTAQGRLARNLSGSFAEWESDVNSERTKAGMAEAVLNGRWVWLLRGYCFKENAQGKRQLYPNEEAQHVKKIFDLAEKGVYTQLEIIEIMKKDGFKIIKQALSKLLRNSVYCGLLPDYYKQNSGEYIKGIHAPIITPEQFFKVQAILDGRRPNIVPRQKNNPLFPLRRYIVCAKCGKLLTACNARGKKIKVPYYQCTTKGCPRFQKKVIEPKYLEYMRQNKPDEKILSLFEQIVIDKFNEKTADLRKDRQKIGQSITGLREEKSRVIGLLAKGIITEHDGQEELLKINAQIAEKESLMSDDNSQPNINESWGFSKCFLLNMDEIWVNADLDLKQRVQGLITPAGFKFEDNLIKPIKTPRFMEVFNQKTGLSKNWGG